MQEVDGSLDIRNELEIGDNAKYEELDIYVRAKDSDNRAFVPSSEEALVNHSARVLPDANIIARPVLPETTNIQNAFAITKQQSGHDIEEGSLCTPKLVDMFESKNGLVRVNSLYTNSEPQDRITAPYPVLKELTAGCSNGNRNKDENASNKMYRAIQSVVDLSMDWPSHLVESTEQKAEAEVPQTEVKTNSLNVVPSPSVSGGQPLPIQNQLQRRRNIEEKLEKSLIRNTTWLPLDQLPRPKPDKIPVFYNYERFPALSGIISQIAEGKSPRPQVTMMYELRICTLRTYPKDNKPFPIKYAASGFYYASDGDGVVCYCCGIRRYGWMEADDPMEVHKRINPRCKFIINNSEHSIAAEAEGPLRQTVARLDMIPDASRAPSPGEDVNNSQRTRTGVQMAIPQHPHMAIKTVREQSFNGNWPNTPKYSPLQLADGGVFFTDLGDCVRCFFCGIGLRHWDKDDDMWVKHARWSQNCTFLIQKKGQNFVDLVQLAVANLDDSVQSSNVLYKNLVSEAAQKVLDQSEYTPQQIKDAVVAMLAIDSNTIVTVTSLKQKVAEQILASDTNIKGSDEFRHAAEPPARNSVVDNEPSNKAFQRGKYLRMNVVPSPSVFEAKQPPFGKGHRKKKWESDEPSFTGKIEKPFLRDATWLPLDQLQGPKLDNIPVLYTYDRFEPLNTIISQIVEGKSPRPQVTMRYELLRLCTLRTYPKDNKPFLIKYAAAGFYYASDGDGVVCYCCGMRRYGWVETDDPMEIHKRIKPKCKFIIDNSENNVPAISYGPLRQNIAKLDQISDCSTQNRSTSGDAIDIISVAEARDDIVSISGAVAGDDIGSISGAVSGDDIASISSTVAGDDIASISSAVAGDDIANISGAVAGDDIASISGAVAGDDIASISIRGTRITRSPLYRNLVNESAQRALEWGYTPRQLQDAIVDILRRNGSNFQITFEHLLDTLVDMVRDTPALVYSIDSD